MEILWGIPQDNSNTQTYGGTTYLGLGAYNANIDKNLQQRLGIEGTGWGGPRVRPEVPNVISARDEERYLFWTEGLSNDLSNIGDWEMPGGSGYMSMKFTYTNENDYYNTSGAIKMNTFNNADFPLFRLAATFLTVRPTSTRCVTVPEWSHCRSTSRIFSTSVCVSFTGKDIAAATLFASESSPAVPTFGAGRAV